MHRFEKASASVYKVRCDKHDKHAMSELCHRGEVLQQVTSGEINPSRHHVSQQYVNILLDVVYIMCIKHKTYMYVGKLCNVTRHCSQRQGLIGGRNTMFCPDVSTRRKSTLRLCIW